MAFGVALNSGRQVWVETSGKFEDDIQVEASYDDEAGGDVTEAEIEEIRSDYSDKIYEDWYQTKIDQAEDWKDSLEDR